MLWSGISLCMYDHTALPLVFNILSIYYPDLSEVFSAAMFNLLPQHCL